MLAATVRICTLASVALIVGCEAPLAPERDQAESVERAAPGSSSLTATAVSANEVALTWLDNSPNEAGFEIHRSDAGSAFALVTTIGANVTSYADVGLVGGTQYCYKVRPFKVSGRKRTFSAFSEVACATTRNPPAAASDVSGVPQNSNVIDIKWTDNSTNEDGFRVQQASSPTALSWTSISSAGPNVTSIQAFVWAEAQVCYRVIAFSAADGEAVPSNVDCTNAPLSPTALTVTSPDVQSVDLAWTDNSSVEDGFEVQRWSEGSAEWTVVANPAANATSYRDAGLAPDVAYWYLVRAKKDGGYSYFSNYAVAVTATTAPNPPSDVVATAYSDYYYGTAVSVSWTDNSGNEEGFRVERGSSNAGPWEIIASTGVNETYFSEGISAGLEVCYRITAYNGRGESSLSSPGTSDCTTLPLAPSALVATTVDHQSIDLSWELASTAVDYFVVFRYDYPSGEFLGSVVVANTERSYRDEGLMSGTSYWYWILTLYDGNYSDYSNDAIATTDADPSTPQTTASAAPRSGMAGLGTLTPPAIENGRPGSLLPRTAPLSARREPSCPSSVPARHECPSSAPSGGLK